MKSHRLRAVMIALPLLGTLDATAQGTAAFIPLGDLAGGVFGSRGNTVSGSGLFAVGFGDSGLTQATLWTGSGSGFSPPLELARTAGSSGTAIAARAVSADGSVVFGECPDINGLRQAVKWTISAGSSSVVTLGYPSTGGYSGTTHACSNDGLAACGDNLFSPPSTGGPPPLPITQAFRWTSGAGVQNLGTLPGVTPGPAHVTSARAMNADGSVVVGFAQDASSVNRPWRWTSSTGIVDISGGAWIGFSRGVSPDGNTVVGSMSGSPGSQPFAWTQATGRIDLGWLGGFDSGAALDASTGGDRVCGVNLVSSIANSQHAVLWIRGEGWKSVRQILVDAGVNMTGWNLQFANSISDDGTVITGYGVNPSGNTEAWVAIIPLPLPPCPADFNGTGGLTVQDIFDFLNAYFGNDPRADFNGSGGITVQDIFDFLNAYFAGCP